MRAPEASETVLQKAYTAHFWLCSHGNLSLATSAFYENDSVQAHVRLKENALTPGTVVSLGIKFSVEFLVTVSVLDLNLVIRFLLSVPDCVRNVAEESDTHTLTRTFLAPS